MNVLADVCANIKQQTVRPFQELVSANKDFT